MEAMQLQVLLILISTLYNVDCRSMSNVKEIIKRLFEEGHYDRKIRPVQDYDEAVHLDVSFFLFSINHLNEAEEKLVTTAYLELVWTDENLHWDPGNHEGIEHFYIPQVTHASISQLYVTVPERL